MEKTIGLASYILDPKVGTIVHMVKKPHWYMCLLFVAIAIAAYRFVIMSQNLIRSHSAVNRK